MLHLSVEDQLDLLKHSLASIPRGILITDCQQADDPNLYANQFFLKMSEYDLEKVIGKNGDKFLNEFTICPVEDENANVTHCIGLEEAL